MSAFASISEFHTLDRTEDAKANQGFKHDANPTETFKFTTNTFNELPAGFGYNQVNYDILDDYKQSNAQKQDFMMCSVCNSRAIDLCDCLDMRCTCEQGHSWMRKNKVSWERKQLESPDQHSCFEKPEMTRQVAQMDPSYQRYRDAERTMRFN